MRGLAASHAEPVKGYDHDDFETDRSGCDGIGQCCACTNVGSAGDEAQIKLIRQHLKQIQSQFLKGDFSGPTHIHGQAMPGLSELKAAKPGAITIEYRDMNEGAELTYKTLDAKMVAALHQWFDAQLSDHGKDAMEGHMHHEGMKMQ